MAKSAEKEMSTLATESSFTDSSHANQWQHPPSFYCPISQQCMHDPVVLSDGHSYERRHIERWLQDHHTSPVSGLRLPSKDIFPNHALRNALEEYFQQVFSAHRRAIRKTMSGPAPGGGAAAASVSLIHAIDALMQCSLLMSADLSIEIVLRQIMEEAKALIGAEAASVFLFDAEREELYSTVNSTSCEIRIPVTVGIAGSVARSGEPLVIRSAYKDSRFDRTIDAKTGFRTRNILCVPLKDRKGAVMGVVQLINKDGSGAVPTEQFQGAKGMGADAVVAIEDVSHLDTFTADDQHFLMVFASQAASAIASSGVPMLPQPPAPRRADEPALDLKKGPPAQDLGGSAAQELLEGAFTSWEFDAFALAKVTGNRPLSVLGMYLFSRTGLVDEVGLDQGKLCCFLEEIEHGYDDKNPYHNRAHAASVLHAMHMLLEQGGLLQALAPALGGEGEGRASTARSARLACLLAAAVHDYQHEGLSNDFLVKSGHERAIRYNDRHVNENHHVAAAFDVLLRPECNFLEHLPTADFRRLRSLVIALVLGTDMAQHGALLKSVQELLGNASADTHGADGVAAAFEPPSHGDAVLLLQLAMKCSDLGHLAQEWGVHVQWVQRLEEEFFMQGDKELEAGLPVSFLMDRSKPGASASQPGFFNAVALPLFSALARAAPAAAPVLASVDRNCEHWKALEASATTSETAVAAASSEEAAERMRRRRHSRRGVEEAVALASAAGAASAGHGVNASEDAIFAAREKKRRSGRARQRAAKFWAAVRRPTPSLSPGRLGA